jgi:hypothetical protein
MTDRGWLFGQSLQSQRHRAYGPEPFSVCRGASFGDRLRDILRPRVARHHTPVKPYVGLCPALHSFTPYYHTHGMTLSTGAIPFPIGAPR